MPSTWRSLQKGDHYFLCVIGCPVKISCNLNPLFHGQTQEPQRTVWFSGWHPFKYFKLYLPTLYPFSRLSIPRSSNSIHRNYSLLSYYPFYSSPNLSQFIWWCPELDIILEIGSDQPSVFHILLEILFAFADTSAQFCIFCKLNKNSPHTFVQIILIKVLKNKGLRTEPWNTLFNNSSW